MRLRPLRDAWYEFEDLVDDFVAEWRSNERYRWLGYVLGGLVALLAALVLGACTPTIRLDDQEYSMYVDLWQLGQRMEEVCGDHAMEARAVSRMRMTTERLGVHTGHRPEPGSRALAGAIAGVIEGVRAGGSPAYCEESARNVRAAAERALRTLGERPQ